MQREDLGAVVSRRYVLVEGLYRGRRSTLLLLLLLFLLQAVLLRRAIE